MFPVRYVLNSYIHYWKGIHFLKNCSGNTNDVTEHVPSTAQGEATQSIHISALNLAVKLPL
jgi:hypothetical protein